MKDIMAVNPEGKRQDSSKGQVDDAAFYSRMIRDSLVLALIALNNN